MKMNLSRFELATIQTILLSAVGLAVLSFSLAAHATPPAAGLERNQTLSHVHNEVLTLEPNIAYTIETTDLSLGGDTVLHVHDRTTGAFIAGNDDYQPPNFRSLVSIPASPSTRSVYVLVRAFTTESEGRGTLRITQSGGNVSSALIEYKTGYTKDFESFKSASHFLTVQEQGGVTDSIILVTSGLAHRGIAFDDDSGVVNMSSIHVDEDCAQNCKLIVAQFGGGTGTASVLWDMDIHEANADIDQDGLSEAFEDAIGTSPTSADSDQDGLDDGEETMGKDGANGYLTRFPYFGATPLQKDLFVQVDWKECVPATPDDRSCHVEGIPNPDIFRMTEAAAIHAAELYAPDVALHLDVGMENTNPATWHTFGAWGAASRHSNAEDENLCQWTIPARHGYFHFARSMYGSGGSSLTPGACLDLAATDPVNFAHELGHNLNLSHGGRQSGGLDINCKPNYPSLMSYAGAGVPNPRFSHKEFGDLALNPRHVIETNGVGLPPNPALLSFLDSADLRYMYDPITGAVDWNRDGQYSSIETPSSLTWAWGGGGGCDVASHQTTLGTLGSHGSALSWLSYSSNPILV